MATAEAFLNRDTTLANRREFEAVIADFIKAIRLDPNNTGAYTNRGNAYYNKGDRNGARADWSKALELDPNNATARDNLNRF
jgi:Flp pilus assembly protein TadD